MIREMLLLVAGGAVVFMIFLMGFVYVLYDIPFIAGLTVVGLVGAISFLFVALNKAYLGDENGD